MRHHYQGKVKGVILDWAGTVLDCGVYSPAIVFMEAFKSEGVPITIEEAREPMGTHKLVHIRRVTQNESVRKRWFEKHGRYPNEDDVTRMYERFVPMQVCNKQLVNKLVNNCIRFLSRSTSFLKRSKASKMRQQQTRSCDNENLL